MNTQESKRLSDSYLPREKDMRDSYYSERRQYPRFDIQLPVKLSIPDSGDGTHLEATSINICMNGLYCTVNRYVPTFDKFLITLISDGHHEIPAHVISQIEGVVVRVEPEQEEAMRNTYNIALFFQALTEQQQNALHSLLSSHAEITSVT